jgi:hypothetical protein
MRRSALACLAVAVVTAGAAQAGDSGSITGRVLANPLSVTIDVPADPKPRGKTFRIRADVANAGAKVLDDVVVTLVRDQGIRLDPKPSQTIPRIPSGESRRVVWSACSNKPGDYLVLARAAAGQFVAESPAELVQILPSNRTC